MAMTWAKSAPANGSVATFNVKAALKAVTWPVSRSSDGTTYNSTGDQITQGGSGAGGMANNLAWFVIGRPGGGPSFCIQRTSNHTQYRVKFSRAAGFVGGSPSATQTPSATDETTLCGGGTDASPVFHSLWDTDGSYRLNVHAEDSDTFGWLAVHYPIAGGSPRGCIALDPLISGHPSDGFIYRAMLNFNSNTLLGAGFEIEANVNGTGATNVIRSTVAAVSPATSIFLPSPLLKMGGNVVIPSGLGTHPISNQDQPFPMLCMRRAASGDGSWKGQSKLFYWNSVSRATASTFSIGAAPDRDRISYGDVNAEWDNSIPAV